MRAQSRITYRQIKADALHTYFEGCLSRGIQAGLPHEQALGYLSYNSENSYTLPVENLMMRAVELGLYGGWFTDASFYIRGQIREIIIMYGLNFLLRDIDSEEKTIFADDLGRLKIDADLLNS